MCNRVFALLAILVLLLTSACQQNSASVENSAENRKRLAEINMQLGIQYLQEGEYQIAVEKLDKAIEADPSLVGAHNAMGLLRSKVGQNSQADASFKRALALDPDNSSVLNNYGQFLCKDGKYTEGQKMFLAAVADPLYRNPALAYNNAGTCAIDAGDLGAAEAHFRAALDIAPNLAPTLYQMAELSFDLKRYPQARGYLARFTENARHTAKSLWLGIRIERELGDKNAVSSYSLQLEKNFPDSPQAASLLESPSQ